MLFFSLQTRICPAPSFLTSLRASKAVVYINRLNRDISPTEIFYITELLAEVNQEFPGHLHARVRKACTELNNYMLRLLPCVDLALVGLSDSICMNIDAAFAFSNDSSVYGTSVCSCMRAIRLNCGIDIGYFTFRKSRI
ncbi:Hypothetical predicted protein [Paramuricea clavata]|uniref:Uncharacterized protein n=1 Tax=Paramuricea clavata TaxID=317549 RepID=A0A7D9EF36_PARCT|nr:Hypothetical predicted protein [Paramuricea clavata]